MSAEDEVSEKIERTQLERLERVLWIISSKVPYEKTFVHRNNGDVTVQITTGNVVVVNWRVKCMFLTIATKQEI